MTTAEFESILANINEKFSEVFKRLARLENVAVNDAKKPGGEVADDSDLDGQYGNPEIRKDPPRWKGVSYAGSRYSDCSADYLDSLAGFLDWKAGKNDEDEAKANSSGDEDGAKKANKYAFYARKDAARARGWAKRIRGGWKPVTPSYDGSSDLPF